MANSALIIGRSKSGKSTSMESLDPKSTFIINVAGKSLPFRGWKLKYTPFNSKDKVGNIVTTNNSKHILTIMDIIDKDMPHINCIVIDDLQYMSSFEYMNRAEETGFSKFNIIGKALFLVTTKVVSLREDLIVFFTNHEEESTDADGNIKIKAKTVGKAVDTFLTLEGLFSIVLRATAKKNKEGIKYIFETQNDGSTTAGSPRGMFDEYNIPNDLELVRQAILNYEK